MADFFCGPATELPRTGERVRYSAANLPVLVPNLSLFWHPDLACDFCLRDFSCFFMHVMLFLNNSAILIVTKPNEYNLNSLVIAQASIAADDQW